MTLQATAPPALKRIYPHVDDITDWRAQQTIRLLWDRVFDLEARLQGVVATQADLVSATNAQAEATTLADRKADEALAIAQLTQTEKKEIITPGTPGTVSVIGRFWVSNTAPYRPCYISGFRLPGLAVTSIAQVRSYLDTAVSLGFNGVRVMAGALVWGSQTAAQARTGLPILLEEARTRNLAIEVTAVTDSDPVVGYEYDVPSHCDAVGQIVAGFPTMKIVMEVANEPWHGTQNNSPPEKNVHDFNNLATWGASYFGSRNLAWACGDPDTDTPDPVATPIAGPYLTIHLNRGDTDQWAMVADLRLLEAASAAYGRPVMNNEPIGWDETDDPGRRCANPSIAYAMGVLSRGFEVGLVSHAESGLDCDPPGPVQTACHQAAVAGFHVFGTDLRLRFEAVNAPASPVASVSGPVTAVYSFMDSPTHGWTVLVGKGGTVTVTYKNGFSQVGLTGSRSGIEVWEVSTGGALPLIAPDMQDEVAQTMVEHPEIDPLDEGERGEIIDITCWRVNDGEDRPWGRKARVNNPGAPDLNTDGMCYLRPDGLFEIYDCISGTTGEATWDGTGPFEQGENGYWWPPEPI